MELPVQPSAPHSEALTRERIAAALAPRHLQCLTWVQEGKSATDIGQILGISGRTVEGHLARACAILGVRTRVQAVIRARRLGLLPESATERLS